MYQKLVAVVEPYVVLLSIDSGGHHTKPCHTFPNFDLNNFQKLFTYLNPTEID